MFGQQMQQYGQPNQWQQPQQQTLSLRDAMAKTLTASLHQLLNNGTIDHGSINQINAWYPSAVENIERSLIAQYGNQIDSQVVAVAIQQYINAAYDQIRQSVNVPAQINQCNQPAASNYGMQPYALLPGRGGRPAVGAIGPNRASIYDNGQPPATPTNQLAILQPQHNIQTAQGVRMMEPVITKDYTDVIITKCEYGTVEEVYKDNFSITEGVYMHHYEPDQEGVLCAEFKFTTTEASHEHMLESFRRLYDLKILPYPCIYTIDYNRTILIAEPAASVSEAFTSIAAIPTWQGKLKMLYTKSFGLVQLLTKHLIDDINIELERSIVIHQNSPIIRISELSDIASLLTLNDETFHETTVSRKYSTRVQIIIDSVFTKYFGPTSRALTSEDDLDSILAYPGIRVRDGVSNERITDISRLSEEARLSFLAKVNEQSLLSVPEKILYISELPDSILNKLANGSEGELHIIDPPSNLLEHILYRRIQTYSNAVCGGVHCVLLDAKTNKLITLNIGLSLNDQLTVSV